MKPIYIGRNGKPVPRAWSQAVEDLTMKYVEVAIRQKVSTIEIRTVLNTFRTTCISTPLNTAHHPQSLIRVVKHLLVCVDKTVSFSSLSVSEDDDGSPDAFNKFLESELAVKSSANVHEQQRKNRAAAALRTFWESYRIALDVIRPTPRLQNPAPGVPPAYYYSFRQVHEEILRAAFDICAKYKLSNDFRRLTWRLRASEHKLMGYALADFTEHREAVQRALVSTFPHEVDALIDTYSMLINTKFLQLNTAIHLESWVETASVFTEVTDILSTINDGHVFSNLLIHPRLILIQFRFLDFLWSGSNTFLHATALKALYDRLLQSQALFDPTNENYIQDLLTQVAEIAKENNFPANSWAFAPFNSIKNGIILSTVLADASQVTESNAGRLFGGIASSQADEPLNVLNTSDYYATNQISPSFNSLFVSSSGFSAVSNATQIQSKQLIVDQSLLSLNSAPISLNIEVFKYSSLLSFEPGASAPQLQILVDFVNNNFSQDQDDVTSQIFIIFKNLTSKSVTPLRLTRSIASQLVIVNNDPYLSQYRQPLYSAIISNILVSLSALYSTISIEKFLTLIPESPVAAEGNSKSRSFLEDLIAHVSSLNNLSIRIDQGTQSLYLRPFPSQVQQRVYGVLGSVSVSMDKFIKPLLTPVESSAQFFFGAIREQLDADVLSIRQRHQALQDKRREIAEAAKIDRENRDKEAIARAEQQKLEQEKKLADIEEKRKEEQRLKEEEDKNAAKRKHIQELVQQQAQDAEKKNFVLSKDMKKQLAKLENVGGDATNELTEKDLLELANKVRLQKKRELLRLKREHKKTVDYTIRALRSAQREVLLKTKELETEALRSKTEAVIKQESDKHKAQWEADIKAKHASQHIAAERNKYRDAIMEQRRQVYNAQKAEYDAAVKVQKDEQNRIEALRLEKEKEEQKMKAAKEEEKRRQKEEQDAQKRNEFNEAGASNYKNVDQRADSRRYESRRDNNAPSASKFSKASNTFLSDDVKQRAQQEGKYQPPTHVRDNRDKDNRRPDDSNNSGANVSKFMSKK
jgi:hypothetical protein